MNNFKTVGSNADREFIAAHRFIRLGYQPIALGEAEIRGHFKMPDNSACADMVLQDARGGALVVECKGVHIEWAVTQLNTTVRYVVRQYSNVRAQIIVNWIAPRPSSSRPLVELGDKYEAKYLQYCHEHVLISPNGLETKLDNGASVIVSFDQQ